MIDSIPDPNSIRVWRDYFSRKAREVRECVVEVSDAERRCEAAWTCPASSRMQGSLAEQRKQLLDLAHDLEGRVKQLDGLADAAERDRAAELLREEKRRTDQAGSPNRQ